MGALVDINTDGLAKLAQIVGNWLGLEARAIERNADANAFASVRKTEAENAAALIRLQGEEQVANYMLAREKRKLNNTISVIDLAQAQFTEGEQTSGEPVNPDWLNRFFSIVEDVSDEVMQKLWAQILAGEVKRPKSYSLRTLELLKNLSQKEAEIINLTSGYLVNNIHLCTESISGENIFGADAIVCSKMDELGIICGEQIIYKYFTYPNEPKNIIIGNTYCLRVHSNAQLQVPIRCYQITTVGRELFSLSKADNLEFALKLAKYFNTEDVSKVELFKIIKRDDAKYSLSTEDLLLRYEYPNEEDELTPVQPFIF